MSFDALLPPWLPRTAEAMKGELVQCCVSEKRVLVRVLVRVRQLLGARRTRSLNPSLENCWPQGICRSGHICSGWWTWWLSHAHT